MADSETAATEPESFSTRPSRYGDLLSRPISADPDALVSYDDWEQDRGASRSFYVGGFRWFLRASGIDDFKQVASFGQAAVEEVRNATTWPDMPESGRRWEECGQPQFKFARQPGPIYFQRAAMIIVACELTLADRLARKKPTRERINSSDIYKHMNIIPACWSVNELTVEVLRDLRGGIPSFDEDLKTLAGQDARTFLDHLAKGQTVTFETAQAVKTYVDGKSPNRIGAINPRPGRHLGRLDATQFERVDTK